MDQSAARGTKKGGKLDCGRSASGKAAHDEARQAVIVLGFGLRPYRSENETASARHRALDWLVIQVANLTGIFRRGILMMMQHAPERGC